MKQKILILAAAFIMLACARVALLPTRSAAHPVAVRLLGYTNEPAGSEAAIAVCNESQANFQLTNHTASQLDFDLDIHTFKPGQSDPDSSLTGGGTLAEHATYLAPVVTPGSTNGRRFVVVTSVSGPRPVWQQHAGRLLARVGVRPSFLVGDRKYPPLTNLWTIP